MPLRQLHRLIYFSRQAFPADVDLDHEVGLIIRSSIANNRRRDITGLLLVHQGWFVQVLEGPAGQVEEVYATIARDPRHSDPIVIASGPTDRRDFGDWNMCARSINGSDSAILDYLDGKGAFDPGRLNAPSALRLLRTVAQAQRKAA